MINMFAGQEPLEATPKVRRPRSDALRNREAILDAARRTFEAEGVMAPLDGIAVLAGVGNATLYRNFPTREDLLAAVIQSSFDDALAYGQELSAELEPAPALAEWLVGLAWRLHIWHELPYCLASAHADTAATLNDSNRPLIVETGRLLRAAQARNQAAAGVTAEQVFELVLALSWAIDRYKDTESVARQRVLMGTVGVFVSCKQSDDGNGPDGG
ncbi:TetR/AcrR family transcriptional regulator [Kaistia dalseonensis]|uniref:AcrR family transcriptional regulator n=1 Tax=Kaistia dalseonensis TaxID=410840 RepID=A0ABU0H943_9HYPH|nr:TetR/AcrR family transcriptional regulator [Kaistia dalseonensis]MCX5496216.1 TetR/AcrR family transcriptional regulator [Kaistia dalseonensis]MDQ0438834.1 AcrR family transcriptional regulator [Kaistia dalseonensis]